MIGLVCMCTKEHLDVAIKASIECEQVSGKTSHENVISLFFLSSCLSLQVDLVANKSPGGRKLSDNNADPGSPGYPGIFRNYFYFLIQGD